MYRSDLGWGEGPFYKVEVVWWYVMGRASRDRLRFCMWSGFGDGSGEQGLIVVIVVSVKLNCSQN